MQELSPLYIFLRFLRISNPCPFRLCLFSLLYDYYLFPFGSYLTSTNSPFSSLYQVSVFILSPSTNAVFTQTGTFLSFSFEYFHSERVTQEPFFAFTMELLPAQQITLSSPVLSIFAEFPLDPICAEFPLDPICAEFPLDPIFA